MSLTQRRVTRSISNKCTISICPGLKTEPLFCFSCSLEYHYSCVGLTDPDYKVICEAAKAGSRWHCSSCLSHPVATSIQSLQQNFDTFKVAIQEELKTMSKGFENQFNSFKESIKNTHESCQESSTKVSESITTYASAVSQSLMKQVETAEVVVELKKDVQSLSSSVVNDKLEQSEIKMREQKQKNIIMFKLPESKSTQSTEAYKEDFVHSMKIIDPENKLESSDIVDLYRIGTKENAYDRPVVIRFNSRERRNEILSLRNLSHKGKDSKITQVFLAPDRTKKEREAHKELVAELKRKRNSEENGANLIIRNGKIVQRQPFRYKPQRIWGCQFRDDKHQQQELDPVSTSETPSESPSDNHQQQELVPASPSETQPEESK